MINKLAVFSCLFPALGFIIAFSGPSCDSIPNKSMITDTTFTHFEKNAIYRIESFHLFNATTYGGATDFSGISACSTWVDNRLDSVAEDSLYGRIQYDKDTVAQIGDSIHGVPKFYVEDIASWKTVAYHFSYSVTSFLGQLFRAGIDSARFSLIQKCLDTIKTHSTRPPAEYVTTILSVLNNAVSDVEFYYKNRDSLMWVWGLDLYIFEPKINRLVNESIFSDSTGKPKTALTVYEKTAIQWFNMELLTSPSIDFIPIDVGSKIFPVFLSSERVHKFVFRQGPTADSIDEKSAVRLLSFNRNGEAQMACRERYADGVEKELSQLSERRILPFPCGSSTNWSATQLFWSRMPHTPYAKVMAMILPGRASLMYLRDTSTFAEAYFDLNFYYPISGVLSENHNDIYFIGSIVTRFRYYRFVFAPFNPGTIANWDTDIYVRRTDSKGASTAYKESYRLSRTQ